MAQVSASLPWLQRVLSLDWHMRHVTLTKTQETIIIKRILWFFTKEINKILCGSLLYHGPLYSWNCTLSFLVWGFLLKKKKNSFHIHDKSGSFFYAVFHFSFIISILYHNIHFKHYIACYPMQTKVLKFSPYPYYKFWK